MHFIDEAQMDVDPQEHYMQNNENIQANQEDIDSDLSSTNNEGPTSPVGSTPLTTHQHYDDEVNIHKKLS